MGSGASCRRLRVFLSYSRSWLGSSRSALPAWDRGKEKFANAFYGMFFLHRVRVRLRSVVGVALPDVAHSIVVWGRQARQLRLSPWASCLRTGNLQIPAQLLEGRKKGCGPCLACIFLAGDGTRAPVVWLLVTILVAGSLSSGVRVSAVPVYLGVMVGLLLAVTFLSSKAAPFPRSPIPARASRGRVGNSVLRAGDASRYRLVRST